MLRKVVKHANNCIVFIIGFGFVEFETKEDLEEALQQDGAVSFADLTLLYMSA